MTMEVIFGKPTRLDVDRLARAFGVPEPKTELTHDAIAEAIECAKFSNRYRTVLSAWRRKLERENNLILVADGGKGFIVADASLRVGAVSDQFKRGTRAIRRAGTRAMLTDRAGLAPEEIRTLDFVTHSAAKIALVKATEAKRIDFSAD